jgi:hypothetical protein
MGIEPPDRPSTDQIVEALVRRARSLGLAADDLDKIVSELLCADAAKRADAGGDLNAELDLAEQHAININNGGLESQLRFLVGTGFFARRHGHGDLVGDDPTIE